MTTETLQVRRATIEDIRQLVELWQAEQLPAQELEKRFKDFQVIEEGGKITAAVAFQVAGTEGLLHSEVFAHPDQSDALREKLWERARNIAANHGLVRVWTQMSAPYWRQNVFKEVPAEVAAKLPPAFAGEPKPWYYVQLKDEAATALSLDKEFALFREAEREETQKLFRQARVLKVVAVVLGIGVSILVVIWTVMFVKAQQRLKRGSDRGSEPHLIRVVGAADHRPAGHMHESHLPGV